MFVCASVCASWKLSKQAGMAPGQGAVPGQADARVFTVERCQHQWLRVGGAVCQPRFGPILQKAAGLKSLRCSCHD